MLRNPFRKLDDRNLTRSSDLLKKQKDYQKIVNIRLRVFMIIIILLFAAIVGKLFDIQVRQQEEYALKLEYYSSKKQTTSTPRGQILDRNQNIVAGTESSLDITYFPVEDATEEQQWELAQKFAEQFNVSSESLTFRDLQDAYIVLHEDENGVRDQANSLLKEEELQLSNDEVYALKLERITKEMIDAELDDKTKAAWVVFSAMDIYSQTSHTRVVLDDVDENQVAYLIEHKSDYPGFDVDFSAWERTYPYENTFKDVLGQVTTSKQGLPAELSSYYLAQGYEMNARVGKSGLEQQYESYLSGTSKVSNIKYAEDGMPVFTEINEGKKGYDIQLTIDIEKQKKVDEILKNVLKKYENDRNRPDMDNLFVSLMNPNTGEIYVMSGMQRLEDNTIINFASGNYLYNYTPGSVVKGATVYMGLSEGVVTPSTIVNDAPMTFQGTAPIASYRNYGAVNAVRALEVSSNVYMVHIALGLAKASYVQNGPLLMDDPSQVFRLMREYYASFGLGALTGLDVPNEANGFYGHNETPAELLFFSFGQYDNYTPIQLLQYVSTIANGGKKMQPYLVSGAYGVNSDVLVYENKGNVISTLDGDPTYLETVQEGFRACVTSGNCGGSLASSSKKPAAKTGTAETYGASGNSSTNASLIGYWPYDQPEVSFVCSAPTSSNSKNLQANICYSEIMPAVMELFP